MNLGRMCDKAACVCVTAGDMCNLTGPAMSEYALAGLNEIALGLDRVGRAIVATRPASARPSNAATSQKYGIDCWH